MSLLYLTPAAPAVFPWLIFDETLAWPAVCGMVVATAGVALASRA